PDPRRPRRLQDAAAAPPGRLQDHRRRRRQTRRHAHVAARHAPAPPQPAPVTMPGSGPVWGAASADLNATLLEWPAGEGPPEHANEERDVLYVVVSGSARLTVTASRTSSGPGRRRSSRREPGARSSRARTASATSRP